MTLKDKTILVTGAPSGIGRAIALACAEKGATIVINYRNNKKGADETLREVEKVSRGVIVQADCANEAQVEKMFREIAKKLGPIDALVNNAGDAQAGDFFDNDAWKYQFENILLSSVWCTQHFLKQNIVSKMRKIVNVGSVYGTLAGGNPDFFSYSVAKAAMASMTTTLAKVDPKVLVNAVAPGYTLTPHWGVMTRAEKKKYERETTIGRFIEPAEVAHAAIALLENDAITGHVLVIDGGLALK